MVREQRGENSSARQIAEIARGQRGGEPQADIGGRRSLRDLHAQRQLRIVGRQPVRFRADQVVEVPPRFAVPSGAGKASRAALSSLPRPRPARPCQPAHQQRGNGPERRRKTRWVRMRLSARSPIVSGSGQALKRPATAGTWHSGDGASSARACSAVRHSRSLRWLTERR